MAWSYDIQGRITGITDTQASANSWSLGYDPLDRVNSAVKTGLTIGWTYDADGNLLSQTHACSGFVFANVPGEARRDCAADPDAIYIDI